MVENELGATAARCVRCSEIAVLVVREFRYVRSWSELLNPRFDPAPTRTATCSACVTTYPIRARDDSAAGAAARRGSSTAALGGGWRRTDVQV